MILLYILGAILMFGILIVVHEMGHFLTARLFGVTIYEFSIGMGPKIISKTSKKTNTAYTLRAFPIGGYVSMAGEDEVSDDAGALSKKPVWQRIIITAAGSLSNLLLGILVMLLVVAFSKGLFSTTVSGFAKGATSEGTGLHTDDKIVAIDGHAVHIAQDMNYKIMRYATKPIPVTVIRDGKKIILENISFPTNVEQGVTFGGRDFYIYQENKTVGAVLKNSFYQSLMTVRMVYDSLYDLITGKYGIEQLSGPVGITSAITDVAKDAVKEKDGTGLGFLFVVLAMNLGCMNLLPLPALDGGRIVFLAIEGIRRKPISPKVEGYIHTVGIVLLLFLMLIITGKDIFTIFKR